MARHRIQLSLNGLIALVAATAVNIWLFRVHILLGIIGLNLSKHFLIAYLCHAVGLDRRRRQRALPPETPAEPIPARELPPSA